MVDLRRGFHLPEEDVEFLNSLNLTWEAIQDGNIRCVVLYGFLLPQPFLPEKVNLKIKIPHDYTSGAALDMFFTDVMVKRSDDICIPRLTESSVFDGKRWWQWSRHYPASVRWRSGVNSLITHICYVQQILEEEAQGKVWA
ncbi:MAG: E2/UBC family protein [Methylophilaceae bacterium]